MLLKDKVAVIYGAGGAIGGAVARAFASKEPALYLTGRTKAPVELVAKEIEAAGGIAEATEVDALDEHGVDAHLRYVVDEAGRLDISFDAIGIPNDTILGVPLVDLDLERFSLPITTHATSYFLTARLAARRMIPRRSGVVMTRHRVPLADGHPAGGRLRTGAGPQGVAHAEPLRRARAARHPRGRPSTAGDAGDGHDQGGLRAACRGVGDDLGAVAGGARSRTHPRRLMTLEEMADVAAFVASDRASGMTGTTVNLTMGSLDD